MNGVQPPSPRGAPDQLGDETAAGGRGQSHAPVAGSTAQLCAPSLRSFSWESPRVGLVFVIPSAPQLVHLLGHGGEVHGWWRRRPRHTMWVTGLESRSGLPKLLLTAQTGARAHREPFHRHRRPLIGRFLSKESRRAWGWGSQGSGRVVGASESRQPLQDTCPKLTLGPLLPVSPQGWGHCQQVCSAGCRPCVSPGRRSPPADLVWSTAHAGTWGYLKWSLPGPVAPSISRRGQEPAQPVLPCSGFQRVRRARSRFCGALRPPGSLDPAPRDASISSSSRAHGKC